MTRINIHVFLIIASVLLIYSCVPPKPKEMTEVKIDLKDSIYRSILNFQDQHLKDSLINYLNNENPTYRYAATMAFASLKDTSVTEEIIKRLHDNVQKVQAAAAYTLGQIGDPRAQDSLLQAFGKNDSINPNTQFNANILEAIGKIGEKKYLKPLATVKSYRPTDTLLLLGQTKGLYRYINRGMSEPEGTEKIIDFIGSSIYPAEVKSICSFYLVKAKKTDLINYKYRIIKLFKKEQNYTLKMNLAIALGKTQDSEALIALKEELNNPNVDSKVKVNIIRALGNFKYIEVIETVLQKLDNENHNIAMAAAIFLYNFGEPNDVIIYRRNAKKIKNWSVKAKLYNAILKHVPTYFSKTKSSTIWDINKQIANSENPFEKADYLRALGEDVNSIKLIYDKGFKAPEIIVRSASMEALAKMSRKEILVKLPKWKIKKFKEEITKITLEAFKSGDVGLVAYAVELLDKSILDLKTEFEDLSFISEAKKSLTIPRDIEAYNAVAKLESKWMNKKYSPAKIAYNNPIDWTVFDELSDTTVAIIKTNKGNFTIKLFKNESPGSVSNFVKLANDNFFDGKKFHRVVPNFVIQTGCTRGDGYGSLDYTIRSELSQINYNDLGFVGMASAGKDTESTQWFVTLAPTPHLDGNYTIFGKVIKGMDTVFDITIGDIIQRIEIIK